MCLGGMQKNKKQNNKKSNQISASVSNKDHIFGGLDTFRDAILLQNWVSRL